MDDFRSAVFPGRPSLTSAERLAATIDAEDRAAAAAQHNRLPLPAVKHVSTSANSTRNRVLCVVPTVWPVAPATYAMVDTWLPLCDRLVISVDARSSSKVGVLMGGRRNVRLTATASIELVDISRPRSHLHPKWLWVRAAIEHAAATFALPRGDFDWLLMAEGDAYVRLPELKRYLRQRRLQPHHKEFVGYCRDGRSPGLSLLSLGALHALGKPSGIELLPIYIRTRAHVCSRICVLARLAARAASCPHGSLLLLTASGSSLATPSTAVAPLRANGMGWRE